MQLLQHAAPFTLVMARLAGVFVAAPILMSTMVPRQYRALLVFMLAVALYPMVWPEVKAPAVTDLFALAGLVVSEGLIGLSMGAIAALPLMSLEMAGVVAGQSMGFGLSRVYNPESNEDTDLIGQLLMFLGTTAFVAMGGLELLISSVVSSFHNVPVGAFGTKDVPLSMFVGVLSSGFELAMRVSAPVTAISMLLLVVFAVIGKTMPQLNIMSVGFIAKILAGVLMLALAIYAVNNAVWEEFGTVLEGVRRWVAGLAY